MATGKLALKRWRGAFVRFTTMKSLDEGNAMRAAWGGAGRKQRDRCAARLRAWKYARADVRARSTDAFDAAPGRPRWPPPAQTSNDKESLHEF